MRKKIWINIVLILIVTVVAGLLTYPKEPNIKYIKDLKIHQGLDLVGGTELTYEADLSKSKNASSDLDNLSEVFHSRINEFGVSEPSIQTAGSNRIIIGLPGISDINQAIERIGQTYDLKFMTEGTKDDGKEYKDYTNANVTYPGFWKPTELSGKNLVSASVQSQQDLSVVVAIKFDDTGKELFKKITTDNLQKRIAIVLDNKIVSAPTVQSAIENGEAVITGNNDIEEAQSLAKRLNEGMLPVPAKLIAQRNIGATLGSDSIHKSFIAGLLGILLVMLFMIIRYKFPGFIACLALVVYSLITISLFKIFSVTLTLAGIAGFILSIGMAVDANILIFERMREELLRGRNYSSSIKTGFARAWTSIRDSNVSSLITCAILFFFGSGIVKGFALTLALGIAVSMFTAITVTRNLLYAFLNNRVNKR